MSRRCAHATASVRAAAARSTFAVPTTFAIAAVRDAVRDAATAASAAATATQAAAPAQPSTDSTSLFVGHGSI